MSFAALEARVNAAGKTKLSNAAATVGGVPGISGIFDDAYIDPLGMSGSQPSLLCASADVSAAAQGAAVVVNAVSYTVGSIQADGTGMTRLLLQEA